MEEEKKETVVEETPVVEPVKEEVADTTAKPAMEVPGNKFALIAFILSVVGFGFGFGWFLGPVGVVLGIVGLAMLKKAAADRKPFSIFQRIAKPLCIVAIIAGAVMFLIFLIVTIVGIIAAAVAAASEAAGTALLLLA